MSTCYGGSDPCNCPVIPCVGCPRIFIHSEGKAQLCPVCNGAGTVPHYRPPATSTAPLTKLCHGCGGRGWVTV